MNEQGLHICAKPAVRWRPRDLTLLPCREYPCGITSAVAHEDMLRYRGDSAGMLVEQRPYRDIDRDMISFVFRMDTLFAAILPPRIRDKRIE